MTWPKAYAGTGRRLVLFAVAALFAGVVAGCEGGDKASPTPERSGIEVIVTDFLKTVRDGDVDRYIEAWHPDGRPPVDRAQDGIGGADLVGCDLDGSETSVRTKDFNTYVDVTFSAPCGDGGITKTCEVYVQRRDQKWWIASWVCPLGSG